MLPTRLLQTHPADETLDLGFRGDEEEYRVRLNDPAELAMTDFRHLTPVTIDLKASVELAVNRMVLSGVRFLFVVDRDERLCGAITWRDVEAARRDRHAPGPEIGATGRPLARVWHMMEPKSAWRVLHYEDVRRARIAEIIIAFKVESRRHLVVAEQHRGRGAAVRGLFSLARLERQLGVPIEINGRAAPGASPLAAELPGD